MCSRIIFSLLLYFSIHPSVLGQKETSRYTLNLYVPLAFYAENYQLGYDTRGRWISEGIELGLNMKYKRWEHELILGSPVLSESTHVNDVYLDSTGRLTQISYETNYHTKISFNYQGAYRVFTNRTKKLNVSLGLGIAAWSKFTKSFDYAGNERFIDYRMKAFLLRPYALSTFNYLLSPRWSFNFSLMFGPRTWIYRTVEFRYTPHGEIRTSNSKFSNNYSRHLIASRIGFGFLF